VKWVPGRVEMRSDSAPRPGARDAPELAKAMEARAGGRERWAS